MVSLNASWMIRSFAQVYLPFPAEPGIEHFDDTYRQPPSAPRPKTALGFSVKSDHSTRLILYRIPALDLFQVQLQQASNLMILLLNQLFGFQPCWRRIY
jgi:hypothetical protein